MVDQIRHHVVNSLAFQDLTGTGCGLGVEWLRRMETKSSLVNAKQDRLGAL